MILTSPSISSLDVLLSWWEVVEYTAEAFVIVGCVGEFIAEFTKIRTPEWRHRLGKLSLLILIAGLTFEFGALVRTNNLSGEEIALLNIEAGHARTNAARFESTAKGLESKIAESQLGMAKAQRDAESAKATAKGFEAQIADAKVRVKAAQAQIASANAASKEAVAKVAAADARSAEATARAAEAQQAAEGERLERVRLEAAVAPRSLSLEQQRLIGLSLSRFAGRRVSLTTYALDGEGAMLGQQIIAALRTAGIEIEDHAASLMPIGGFSLGVHVSGQEADLTTGIAFALASIGHLVVAPPNSPSGGGAAIGMGRDDKTEPPPVSILVGVKPVPIMGR
jgi:hypothetical protein